MIGVEVELTAGITFVVWRGEACGAQAAAKNINIRIGGENLILINYFLAVNIVTSLILMRLWTGFFQNLTLFPAGSGERVGKIGG